MTTRRSGFSTNSNPRPAPSAHTGPDSIGARIEARMGQHAPQVPGRRIAILAIAFVVLIAVLVNSRIQASKSPGGDTPNGGTPPTTTDAGSRDPGAPADGEFEIDASLAELPPPPDDLANSIDWVKRFADWTRDRNPAGVVRIVDALSAAGAAERAAARVWFADRVQVLLAGERPSRAADLALLARLADLPGEPPLPERTRERLAAHAGLLLDDPSTAEAAVLVLGALPPEERAGKSLWRLVEDGTRPLALRVLAAVALPRPLSADALALAQDPATPAWLKQALR